MSEFVAPTFLSDGFHCPHCNTWSQQEWFYMTHQQHMPPNGEMGRVTSFFIAQCQKRTCKKVSIWITTDGKTGNMIYPGETTAPLPIDNMPENVRQIYEEARQIYEKSPRAAAGLLRLSIQVLMPHLGEATKNLNEAIGNLVKKGLPLIIQQALDSLRVVGNNAVHPGQIEVNDDRDTALALFHILNTIIDRTIVQDKRISEVYEKLPPSAKEQIRKRDAEVERAKENGDQKAG
jgi:hypothetical protein